MKELLKKIIIEALKTNNINKTIDDISIEIPKDSINGDYSTNIAMQLSKELKIFPRDIASQIIMSIKDNNIDKIEIAGPGFINFFIKKDYLLENIDKVLQLGDNYGKLASKNHKVNVEYVSANPTGTLHLGHARGASFGDSLTRILAFAGFDVTREYYINDAGNQIGNLTKSIEARYRGLCGLEENMPEDGYYGKEVIEVAKDIYNEYGNNLDDKNVYTKKGLELLLSKIKKDLKDFGVEFDIWSSEQALYGSGKVNKVLEDLKKNKYTYEQDNALWLQTTLFGDEKDRVLVKSDGTNTYLLPDIAYHMEKYSRGYDSLINVFGADHHGYIPRLKAALSIVGEDSNKLDVEILQMVRLVKSGQEVKMSKRTGNAVSMMELVEEVGLDAVRYFFAMRSIDTQMDFDLDLATKNTNENPVYYVQYAHARINSIINEYSKQINKLDKYNTITSDYAYDLLAKLYQFESVIDASASKRAPHIITNYVYELANLFHVYYAHEKVLTDDEVYTQERINMIKAVAITIKNALKLIGVTAKERM